MIRIPFILILFLFVTSCKFESEKLFTKLEPDATGIHFKNVNIETEDANILTYEYFYNGGGVALGDINNDGLLDVYFTSNSEDNRLYINKGSLEFKDITGSAGVSCKGGWKTGVSMVDINNDGWLDIYVCRSGPFSPELRKNILLINNKDLTFTNQAEAYGLADDSFSTQASFFDYDRDGDLDVFLLNHSLLDISNSVDISNRNTKKRTPYVGNRLLRNENGKFVDVSDSLGIFGPASNYGLGIGMSDLNDDGWIDIYAGSDFTGRDKLLINQHGKFFLDATDSMLSHISKYTMGVDIADFNGDGLMDIYTLDMLPEDNKRQKLLLGTDKYNIFHQMVRSGLHYQYMRNMLQMNTGAGYFSEVGQLAGIATTDWSWTPLFADFNNDGVQDLFVSNGFKRDLTNGDFAKYHAFQIIEENRRRGRRVNSLDLIEKFNENRLHNYIFKGNGDLSFTNVFKEWGFEEPTLTNGVAYGDLDNDGDLDLVMNQLNDVASIYRNNSPADANHHYLQVTAVAIGENRSAIGSKITVYAGDKIFTRELFPVRGFQSSVDPVLHVGLGEEDHIDSLVIRWPSGKEQSMYNLSANKRITVVEKLSLYHTDSDGKSVGSLSRRDSTSTKTFFKEKKGIIDFVHKENDFVDFNIQPLLPRQYSTMGPALVAGDVNGDGLADIYTGGAKGQAGKLFLQNHQGTFVADNKNDFGNDKNYEDTDAIFFDANNDGHADLYVVSGGYEFAPGDTLLQDRLYLNDGRGNLQKCALPEMLSSGSCVRAADLDRDGDLDLFVGGRIVPGRYPETPLSYILLNNGKGIFSIDKASTEVARIGMVTDAVWVDLNHDQFDDLIVVGEWMGIEVFINDRGSLKKMTENFIKENTSGWWNCIRRHDFDHDGDEDFIVGNAGMNNLIKASPDRPATLVFSDYDNNGSVDPLLNYYIMDKRYPYPAGDELVDQVPMFKKRFTNNTSYATSNLENILTPEELQKSTTVYAYQMQSIYLRNDNDHLTVELLPIEMQIAPVFAIEVLDANQDGKDDFLAMGNLSATRARTGKMSGNSGFLFLGDGTGKFQFTNPRLTGLRCTGDVRHIVKDNNRIFIGINNDRIKVYEMNTKPEL